MGCFAHFRVPLNSKTPKLAVLALIVSSVRFVIKIANNIFYCFYCYFEHENTLWSNLKYSVDLGNVVSYVSITLIMKLHLIAATIATALFGVACSTTDLGGSLPLPFTEPATSAKLELELRPLPPKFCIGLELVPTSEEPDTGETAE